MKRHANRTAGTGLAAGCLLLFLSGVVQAGEPDDLQTLLALRDQVRASCQASAESLCGGEQGPHARMRCLMERSDEVTEECRTALDALRQEMDARREALSAACGESMETLCAGREGPDMVRCLKRSYAAVSEDCQAFLDEMRQEMDARREALSAACGESMETLCVGREGPDMVRCLKRSYAAVSEDCQAFLDEVPDRPGPAGPWGRK